MSSQAGSARETVDYALGLLSQSPGVSNVQRSRHFATPAFPPGSGPEFVNAALSLETTLTAAELLAVLHEIEASLGRVREKRWDARIIDLDLLAHGNLVVPDLETFLLWRDMTPEAQQAAAPDRLILPHPRLQDRGFVLAPLNDVAAQWRHPVFDRTVAEMLADLPEHSLTGIRLLP